MVLAESYRRPSYPYSAVLDWAAQPLQLQKPPPRPAVTAHRSTRSSTSCCRAPRRIDDEPSRCTARCEETARQRIRCAARKDEAAAAAQDLLKVDAARVHKTAAAQSRKDAAAPMRKAHGRARVPLVPKQSSSGYGAAYSTKVLHRRQPLLQRLLSNWKLKKLETVKLGYPGQLYT
uniref:Uncharacterized protein n=1 Tax=Leersia perrieri TaxID=77586 RepID=A0A0D9X455_9ORYZ